MKHARRKRASTSAFWNTSEVLDCAGATTCNERHRAQGTRCLQLIDIVPALHAIAAHAVE